MIITQSSKDLKPVLMNSVKTEIKTPNYLIKDQNQLIFVVTPGKNGSEFNKTVGYFSSFPGMQTYQCLYGQGIFIIQRTDETGEAKEFKVVSLNPGKQILVPAGWGICMVNSSDSYLVVLRNSFLDEKYIDSKLVLEKRGFAYYVVQKKGEVGFEPNPSYSIHPQIVME